VQTQRGIVLTKQSISALVLSLTAFVHYHRNRLVTRHNAKRVNNVVQGGFSNCNFRLNIICFCFQYLFIVNQCAKKHPSHRPGRVIYNVGQVDLSIDLSSGQVTFLALIY